MWRCRERVRGRNNNIIIIIRETIRTKLCNAILCISPHMSAQSWWCLCRSSRRIPCLCDWLGIRSEWVMPDGRQPKAECARTRVLTNVMHKHSCRRCWQRTSRDHRRERSKTEMKSYAIWLSIEASDLKSNVQSTHAIHLRFFCNLLETTRLLIHMSYGGGGGGAPTATLNAHAHRSMAIFNCGLESCRFQYSFNCIELKSNATRNLYTLLVATIYPAIYLRIIVPCANSEHDFHARLIWIEINQFKNIISFWSIANGMHSLCGRRRRACSTRQCSLTQQ